MGRCPAIKADGERCRGDAPPGAEWCYSHDPALREVRRRNASRGGKSGGRGRPQTETAALKKEIRALIADVRGGNVPQGPGAVALQGYNALLRVLEHERRQGTPESGVLTHEALVEQMQRVVEVVMRHLPRDKWEVFDAELGAIIDEASDAG